MTVRPNKVLLCVEGVEVDKVSILNKLIFYSVDELRLMEPKADLIILFKKDGVSIMKHRYGPTGKYEYFSK